MQILFQKIENSMSELILNIHKFDPHISNRENLPSIHLAPFNLMQNLKKHMNSLV